MAMTDYLGNEINVGDVVIYTNGDSTDYPYRQGVVTGFTSRRKKDRVWENGQVIDKYITIDYVVFDDKKRYRQGHSLINLTSLGVRSKNES